MNILKELANGGGFSLPFLIHLYDAGGVQHIYLINDCTDFEYSGHVYSASNFTYTPKEDGSASLSVEIVRHSEIIDLLENNYEFRAEVVGLFNGEDVQEIGMFRHKYGDGSWDGKKLEIKFDKDDRGNMTFPALVFNSYNNRGN